MPRRPRALVLDSWAVLAFLGDEASGQEVADLITFLVSERSGYLTGASILVDGGLVRALV